MGMVKCTVRYDGRPYYGWQRLKDKPTVQGTIEDALAVVLGEPCPITGAGRTDRGAHAEGQVFGAVVPEPAIVSLASELNAVLPKSIRVRGCVAMPEGFHARESATGKIYRYRIWNRDELPEDLDGLVWHARGALEPSAMAEACHSFIGKHDFASFATKPNFKQASTVRELRRFELEFDGPDLCFELEADGFLYKMVRNLVRCVAKVGEGKLSASALPGLLAARDRKVAPGTAPASGLSLHRVLFD